MKQVVQATKIETGEVQVFKTQTSAARALGLLQPCVSFCLSGRNKTHGGYTFEWILPTTSDLGQQPTTPQ